MKLVSCENILIEVIFKDYLKNKIKKVIHNVMFQIEPYINY